MRLMPLVSWNFGPQSRRRCGLLPLLCLGVWLGGGTALAAAPTLPGTEITPQEMQRAFPKPLERRAPHMSFTPGPAPLLPEAPPMRVPEPSRPPLPVVQGPVSAPPPGAGRTGDTGRIGGAGGAGSPAVPQPQGKSEGAQGAPSPATPASAAPSVAPATSPGSAVPATQAAQPQNAPGAAPAAGPRPVPEQPSVEMMVGQMLMVGFSGAELKSNAPVLDMAARGVIGGVLLLPRDPMGPRNIVSPAQLRVLTATLQKAAREGQGSGGVPLFLAVEQEGGMAQALESQLGFEGGAAAARLGRGSTEATGTAARRMGLEMAALGLNFNFAPVADANVNPLNEDIGKKFRSFSPNPAQAAAHARAFGQGMAAAGIVPCLKYFPGTGSVAASPFAPAAGEAHFGPPDLAGTWQMLELTPFREVLRQQWPGAVQPALAYHRGLDALYPATLSPRMLTDILRNELSFSGVIVSNDLEALGRLYSLEDALLLAVRAGADILLLPARQGIASGQGPSGPSGPGAPQNLPAQLQALAGVMGGDTAAIPELAGGGAGAGGDLGEGSGGDASLLGALAGGGGMASMLRASGLLPSLQRGVPRTGQVSDNAVRAHAALVQMVRDGRISEERLRLSWHRIMKLKKSFLYLDRSHSMHGL